MSVVPKSRLAGEGESAAGGAASAGTAVTNAPTIASPHTNNTAIAARNPRHDPASLSTPRFIPPPELARQNTDPSVPIGNPRPEPEHENNSQAASTNGAARARSRRSRATP